MNQEKFIEKIREELGVWNEEIDNLKIDAETSIGEKKERYNQELAKIHRKQEDILNSLNELGDTGEDEWNEARERFEYTWDEFINTIQKAINKLK
jgi:ribosome recycling factor